MNERQKRITRIISLQEYKNRRYAHDLPKAHAQDRDAGRGEQVRGNRPDDRADGAVY